MPKEPLYEAGLEALHSLKRAVQISTANPDVAVHQKLKFQGDLLLISNNSGWLISEIEREAQRISLLGKD